MHVYTNPQRQWLAAAEQELAQRLEARQTLNQRITELQQIIQTLRPVLQNQEEMADVSLPKLCLKILSFSGTSFQPPTQVRDGLRKLGLEVPGQNPMAVIHTTLSRLSNSGFAQGRTPRLGAPIHYRITNAGRLALEQAGI